jgi:hypothetical protein
MRDYNFFEIYEKQGVLSINKKSPLFIGIIIVLLVVVLAIGLVVRNVVLQYQINDYTEKTRLYVKCCGVEFSSKIK